LKEYGYKLKLKRVVSHIQKFGDAVVSRWRCIISFRDAHHTREVWSQLQIAVYVTLLSKEQEKPVYHISILACDKQRLVY
jgi:hypothetical protein